MSLMGGRWILVSGIDSEAGIDSFTGRLTQELALQHHVLLWDIPSLFVKNGKTSHDLMPYRNSFSANLLRNFLSQGGQSVKILRSALEGTAAEQKELCALLRSAFDYVV